VNFVCGLSFVDEELEHFRVLVAEFLQPNTVATKQSVTLKFHNLIHYSMAIKQVGSLVGIEVRD
jgi:hypothetical protein